MTLRQTTEFKVCRKAVSINCELSKAYFAHEKIHYYYFNILIFSEILKVNKMDFHKRKVCLSKYGNYKNTCNGSQNN